MPTYLCVLFGRALTNMLLFKILVSLVLATLVILSCCIGVMEGRLRSDVKFGAFVVAGLAFCPVTFLFFLWFALPA